MSKRRWAALAAVVAAGAAAVVPGAGAADPGSGSVTSAKPSATWSGGPFTVSNPATCVGPDDPTCDTFTLTIDGPAEPFKVDITIGTADHETDDYDVYVYGPDGSQVGSSAHEGTTDEEGNPGERVTLPSPPDGVYQVQVQPFAVAPGSTYQGTANLTVGNPPAIDEERDCLELVPASAGVSGLTDGGRTVDLRARVLYEGMQWKTAKEIMNKAAKSYTPLDITLTSALERVDFVGNDPEQLIAQSKDHFGGKRPAGYDLVVLLTNQNLTDSEGDDSVIGQADCIGGIRWDEHAFAVSEVTSALDDASFLGVGLYVDEKAKTVAHEIGHLMGAHHHYANCVEGLLDDTGPEEVTPCTVMWLSSPASTNFGALEGMVVRGHAFDYARHNDKR